MAYAGAGLSASIRGLNYDDTENPTTTVGVTIDGVFAANNGGVNLDFLMVSQSKFCVVHREHFASHNTIGGVINIKRSKPTRTRRKIPSRC